MTATASRRGSSEEPEYVGEEMTLFEHLEELRSRLFKCALAVAVGFVVGFVLRTRVLDLLRAPYCDLPPSVRDGLGTGECTLIVLRVLDSFLISIKAAAVVAVVIAGPVVFYQVWRFVTPGLRPVERRYAIPFVLLSQALFVGGAVFAYLIIPRGLAFLLSFAGEGITPVLSASEYIGFILKTLIGFGISFELPLIIAMMTLMGVVGSAGLRRYRRHAIFGTFVLAAVITPTQDPLTMTMMAAPLALFYELNIVFARIIERRRRASGTAVTVAE